METKIKAIHFDISEKLESYINKKADKLARRFDAISELEATLKVVKPETAANKEVGVKVSVKGAEFFASKTADTFEEAFNNCLDAIEPQLEKNKNN